MSPREEDPGRNLGGTWPMTRGLEGTPAVQNKLLPYITHLVSVDQDDILPFLWRFLKHSLLFRQYIACFIVANFTWQDFDSPQAAVDKDFGAGKSHDFTSSLGS